MKGRRYEEITDNESIVNALRLGELLGLEGKDEGGAGDGEK